MPAVFLAAAALLAGEARAEVTVSLEEVRGSALRRGVATTVLEMPEERLFRAMTDVAHWPEFMPFMAASAVVPGARDGVWEQQLDLPFPLRDRHYRVRVEARQEEHGSTVTWRHVAGSGDIRGLEGELILRALPGERTWVELRLWSDLGGLAPVSRQESMLARSLGWILDGLRQQARRCRYDRPVAPSCGEEPARPVHGSFPRRLDGSADRPVGGARSVVYGRFSPTSSPIPRVRPRPGHRGRRCPRPCRRAASPAMRFGQDLDLHSVADDHRPGPAADAHLVVVAVH